MAGTDKALDDLRDAVSLPVSPMEKIGFLVLGLATGYFLPRVVGSSLLHLAGPNLSTRSMLVMVLGTYALCLPAVWSLWDRKRYLAIGILIPVLVQALVFASAFALWVLARISVRLP